MDGREARPCPCRYGGILPLRIDDYDAADVSQQGRDDDAGSLPRAGLGDNQRVMLWRRADGRARFGCFRVAACSHEYASVGVIFAGHLKLLGRILGASEVFGQSGGALSSVLHEIADEDDNRNDAEEFCQIFEAEGWYPVSEAFGFATGLLKRGVGDPAEFGVENLLLPGPDVWAAQAINGGTILRRTLLELLTGYSPLPQLLLQAEAVQGGLGGKPSVTARGFRILAEAQQGEQDQGQKFQKLPPASGVGIF